MTVGNQLLDFLIDAEATRFVKNSWLSKLSSEARMSRETLKKPFLLLLDSQMGETHLKHGFLYTPKGLIPLLG